MQAKLGKTLLSLALAFALLPTCAWAGEGDANGTAATDDAATVQETSCIEVADDASYVEGELIVVYDDAGADDAADEGEMATLAAEQDDVAEELAGEGIEVADVLADATDDAGTAVLATIEGDESVEQAIAAAESVEGVAYAQPNYVYSLLEDGDADVDEDALSTQATFDDPFACESDVSVQQNQYYLYGDLSESTGSIGANVVDAWDYATCDNDVTIAVLDTGVRLNHVDLADNILTDYCYDFYNDEALVATSSFSGDYYGHGTHVAGIAAGVANNGTGIAGASYNANIIAYKITDDSTSDPLSSTSTLIAALETLVELVESEPELNICVANISMGAYADGPDSSDEAMHTAIQDVTDAGVLVVCAGGNGSGNTPYTQNVYPADYDECISVTALDTDGTNAVWSDFNEEKDISAPGISIVSTYNGSTASYASMTGTSMASPLVAGIAALLFAVNPNATADDVIEAIEATADDVDDSRDMYKRNSRGYRGVVSGSAGAINAAAAAAYIAEPYIDVPDDFDELYCTQSVQLTAVMPGLDDEELEWTWSVECDTGSATIDESGLLTGTAVGTVTVTASAYSESAGSLSAEREFTVYDLALSYTDVVEGTWYYEAISYVVNNGLMTGYTGTTLFGVGKTMNRAQLATVMWRIACSEEAAAYAASDYSTYVSTTDESTCSGIEDGQYWTAAADWCVANSVIEGYEASDGSRYFNASGVVSFEQLCQVLANYIDYDGRSALSGETVEAALAGFTDGDAVSTWARASMAWCVQGGIVSGYENANDTYTIKPAESVKRERAAVVFMRVAQAGLL